MVYAVWSVYDVCYMVYVKCRMVAVTIIPWEVYTRSGDLAIVKGAYDAAKGMVDFLTEHIDADVGLIQFGYYGRFSDIL